MGGVGFSLKIAPAGSNPDPKGLYEAIYDCVERNIERFAKGKPYEQVTADYLGIAREDGAGYPKEIQFGFKDGAGLCSMSSDACYHWFHVLVAALRKPIDALAAQHDLKITTKPEPLAPLLKKCKEPLVELRGILFATGELDGEVYITSDDLGDDTLAMEDLTPKERARVEKAFRKQRCDCKVCAALRAKKKLVLPKAKPKTPKTFKTTLTDGHRSISDWDDASTITEVPVQLLAPDLKGLTIRLPAITTFPEELASLRSLKRLSFYHTKIRRLPEVVTRMPWIEELSISEGELDGFDDLAKLPNLRELRLNNLKKVGARFPDFPVDALASLEELVVTFCDAEELPKEIGRLAKLRRLDLSGNAFQKLPASFGALRVDTLSFNDCEMTTLPRIVGEIESLRTLNAGSALVRIEEGALPRSLTSLQLHFSNALDSLPESFGELASLESLYLHGAALTRLPDGMRNLRKLTSLRLDDNDKLVLPDWLGELGAMEFLALDGVPMTELPSGIRNMRRLKELWLEHTKVFPLPDWIGELPLERLRVRKDDMPRGELARLDRLLPKAEIVAR